MYLDNFVILSRTPQDHTGPTNILLRLLKGASVVLELKKCALFTNFIDYPGHVIKTGQLVVTK